jgi:hypothetical protein
MGLQILQLNVVWQSARKLPPSPEQYLVFKKSLFEKCDLANNLNNDKKDLRANLYAIIG